MTTASTTVTITLPTTRVDGSALEIAQIASVVLSKATGAGPAAIIDTVTAPTTPTISFVDANPDPGATDNYTATVTDVEGNVSAMSNVASVLVPPSVLAAPSAPTVSAVFTPAA